MCNTQGNIYELLNSNSENISVLAIGISPVWGNGKGSSQKKVKESN